MTLRSSFSKEVQSELRRNIWAPVLSLIGFLFCLPLPIAIILQDHYQAMTGMTTLIGERREEQIERVCRQMATWLGTDNVLVSIGIFIMATLCGVAIFRYLHDRRQVDLFHALPVSRTHLFAVRYVTGLVAVLPAYIVIHLVTAAVVFALGFSANITFGGVLGAIGMNVMFFLCLYAVAILCTVLTGNTVITVALGIWVSFFIPAFFGLIMLLQQQYYATYYDPSLLLEKIVMFGSPLVAYFMQASQQIFGTNVSDVYGGAGMIAIYIVATIVLTVLCLVLFRIRHSERAGSAMAFEGAKLPVKAVVCVILALCGYIFFESVIGSFWKWFGFAVFLVLGHALVEIVYHFDFRKALAHLPHMILFGAVAAAIILGIQMDVTGFDRYRPANEEIAGMRVNIWSRFGAGNARSRNIEEDEWLTDPALIDELMALVDEYHAGGAPYADMLNSELGRSVNLNVAWKLGNGKIVSRTYSFDSIDPNMDDRIVAIVNHPDFLRVYSSLQALDMTEWQPNENSVFIRNAAVPDGAVALNTLYDDWDIASLLTAMQQAELARDTELMGREAPVLRVDVRYTEKGNTYQMHCDYLPVYACDTEVLALIRELTGIEPVTLTSEHVKSMEVRRDVYVNEMQEDFDHEVYYEEYGVTYMVPAVTKESSPDRETVHISDPAVIDALLRNGVPGGMHNAAADWFALEELTYSDDAMSVHYQVSINLQNSWENFVYPEGSAPLELIESLF